MKILDTFPTTEEIEHILGASSGIAAKKFPFVADITREFNLLCLYMDIVEHWLAENFLFPLSCCVPNRSNDNEAVMVTYDKLYCACKHNKHVSFCFVKVIVKLHLWTQKSLKFEKPCQIGSGKEL